MNRVKSIPKRLISVSEIVVDCRYWKVIHTKLPYKYNGTRYVTQYACTATKPCDYKNGDPRTGGCAICGNVAKIPQEDRP